MARALVVIGVAAVTAAAVLGWVWEGDAGRARAAAVELVGGGS